MYGLVLCRALVVILSARVYDESGFQIIVLNVGLSRISASKGPGSYSKRTRVRRIWV